MNNILNIAVGVCVGILFAAGAMYFVYDIVSTDTESDCAYVNYEHVMAGEPKEDC